MSLFKRKNKIPNLYILLNDEFARMKEQNKKCFYHLLYENEIESAQQWCLRNNVYMAVDHKTDSNIIYKFFI